MRRLLPILSLALLCATAFACECDGDPDNPEAIEEGGQRFLLCGRLADDDQSEEIDTGTGVRFKRDGFVLERLGEAEGTTRLGVISGVEEWNEPNRSNLKALTAWFEEQRVEALIVAGGIGPDRETCRNVLGELAKTGMLIMPLIGASADFAGYRRAIAQVRQKNKNIVDLTTARLVRWGGVDLVTLPGYHNPFYLSHRRGGCAYLAEDVEALAELIEDARQRVLLIAAGPPRGRGIKAVDRARGGVNIGDPQITKLIKEARVPFGVFGHVYEAGGAATMDVDGGRPVPPGRWSETLYLNPGAAEAVPYDLVGGGRSRGMGVVLEFGSQAEGVRYHLHTLERIPPGEERALRPEKAGQEQAQESDAGSTQ